MQEEICFLFLNFLCGNVYQCIQGEKGWGRGGEGKHNKSLPTAIFMYSTVVCSVYNQHTNNMTHNVVLSRSYPPPPSPLLLSSQINTIYSFQLTTSSEVVVLDGYKKGVYCVLDAIFPPNPHL